MNNEITFDDDNTRFPNENGWVVWKAKELSPDTEVVEYKDVLRIHGTNDLNMKVSNVSNLKEITEKYQEDNKPTHGYSGGGPFIIDDELSIGLSSTSNNLSFLKDGKEIGRITLDDQIHFEGDAIECAKLITLDSNTTELFKEVYKVMKY